MMSSVNALLLGVVVTLLSVASVCSELSPASYSLDRFLDGRWLVRPFHTSTLVQPYTHEVVVKRSSRLDGEVAAVLSPYVSPDVATSIFANFMESVVQHLMPIVTEASRTFWDVSSMLTGIQRGPSTLSARQTPQTPQPSHCYLLQQCNIAANLSVKMHMTMHGPSTGVLRLSFPSSNLSPEEEAAKPSLVLNKPTDDFVTDDGTAVAATLPVQFFTNPTDSNKYRRITTTSVHRVGIPVPAGCPLAVPTVILRPSAVLFIDDSNAAVTIVYGESGECVSEVLLKRISQSEEAKSLSSLVGTLGLLVVVALFKFGPRWYMKWKGINPLHLVSGRKTQVNKQSPQIISSRPSK